MRYKNQMRFNAFLLLAIAAGFTGCNAQPAAPSPAPLAATTAPVAAATSQPADVVAHLATLNITRSELDDLLYESYGLRMLFDLVELDLAKATLLQRGEVITPQDIQQERQKILAGISGEGTDPARYEELFTQFLQREHITRAEFDLKIVQTDACLRKIVVPLVVGKLPEADVRRGFEILYGAKREIEDIELANVREAEIARQRLKTEAFEQVAVDISIDQQTAPSGGRWAPFSAQDPRVPQAIKDAAFSLQKGRVSDIVVDANGHYHLIKVINVIDPVIVKYEAVKDDVRKKLEETLITLNMKNLRQELQIKTQMECKPIDPKLKALWDAEVEKANKTTDREGARQKLNNAAADAATRPAGGKR